MTHTSRNPRRLVLALTVASVGLATSACGSNASGTAASSATSASSNTPASSNSPAASPAASNGSASNSPSASASTTRLDATQLDATQLDKAVAATSVNGAGYTPMSQGQLKQARDLLADTARRMQQLTYTPAACKMAANLGQMASGQSTTAPMSIGQDKTGRHTIAAIQLPAGAPDNWSNADDVMKKCSTITVKGDMSGIPVDMTLTMSPLAVTSTQAQQVHGMIETIQQKGRTQVQSVAVGRVGDVMVESEVQGRATAQELGAPLDALAAQVRKLG